MKTESRVSHVIITKSTKGNDVYQVLLTKFFKTEYNTLNVDIRKIEINVL